MVNGKEISDEHSLIDGQSIIPFGDEEEHDDGASSSTEIIPDPTRTVAQGIEAEPGNVGDGEAPAQLNLPVGGLAAPAPAHDATNVGVGAHNPDVAPADGVGAHDAGAIPAGGVGAHDAGAIPAGGVGAHNAVIGGAQPRALHANDAAHAGGAAMALAAVGVGGNAVALAQAGAGVIANAGGAPAGQAPVQPYFDLDAGLSGPPLRRSEFGPFF